MSLAEEMRLNFRGRSNDYSKQALDVVRDFVDTSSVEIYNLWTYKLETGLPLFVEILKMSKNVNRVYVDGDLDNQAWLDSDKSRESLQLVFVQLMEILHIETMKHVEFFIRYPCWCMNNKCSLNLELLENCFATEKIG